MHRQLAFVFATLAAILTMALAPRPATAAQPSAKVGPLRAIDFINATTGWAAGDGTIVATTDGGRTWHSQYTGRISFTSLSFTTGGYGWAAGVDPIKGNGVLMGTTNGGATWKKLQEPRNTIRTLNFYEPSLGVAVAGGSPMDKSDATERSAPFFGGRLAIGTNDGASWHFEDQPLLIDSACTAGGYASFAAYQAAVLISTSLGTDWQHVYSAPVDTHLTWYSTVHCNSGSIWALFATNGRGMQQRSYLLAHGDQTGHNWVPVMENKRTPDAYPQVDVSDGPAPAPGDFSVPDANTVFFLGVCLPCGDKGTVTIVSSTDAGAHWSSVATIPGINAETSPAVSFVDLNHGWVAGSKNGKGVILASGDGGKSWNQVYSK